MVIQGASGAGGPPYMNRRPSGDSPGQKRFAMESLMIATAGASAVSDAENSRPDLTGIPIVAKYPGATESTGTSTLSAGVNAGRPSMLEVVELGVGDRNRSEISDAASTPGNDRTGSTIRVKKFVNAGGSRWELPVSVPA